MLQLVMPANGTCKSLTNPVFPLQHFDTNRTIESIEARAMQLPTAVEALSALANASRLAVFRLLVRTGLAGMAAGDIAREVGARPNTLSTHLTILGHAGLVRSRRDGRSIIYSADYDSMRDLLGFLVADCCAGRPEICGALATIAADSNCCPS
jgi:ArsR family transcriptional regulator, arsenate/arsenite/antimonite-responsive transcriptional repressor